MDEKIKYITQEQQDAIIDGTMQTEEGFNYMVGTEDQIKAQADGVDPNAGGGEGGGEEFTPSPYWDYFKSKLPEDQRESFAIPEEVNAENEQEFLDKKFKEIYAPEEDPLKDIHPLAREIIDKSKEENFSAEEFIKSKAGTTSLSQASDDDLLKAKYINEIGIKSDENPNGMNEEEILKGIDEMNSLEKKKLANEERVKLQKQVEQSFNYKPDPAAMQKQVTDYNKGVSDWADNYFSKGTENSTEEEKKAIISRRTIAGVDLGEAKFQEFKESFAKDFQIGEDGKASIQEMLLNNDEALAKAYLFLKNEDVIRQALTRKFNDGVDFTMEKLLPNGRQISGAHGNAGKMSQEEIDARLNAPEGSFGD